MRTILSGPVQAAGIALADLWGIVPSSFVTNGLHPVPKMGLPVTELPLCQKFGDRRAAERARNYTLVQNADALIVAGGNEHLVALAETYGLPVFQDS